MTQKPIIVENLTKRFGDFVAVNNVSFDVDYGEIFGFLGPNGSGKSTTIKMLTGLLTPSDGNAWVAGYDIRKNNVEIRKNIGYMSQKFSLYMNLTVMENLNFYTEIYEIPKNEINTRISETLERLNLGSYVRSLAKDLPAGIKQRLALGISYIQKPRIIFLDEPTAGVDPSQRRIFWDWIYDISSSGVAIFVTTHYMDEVEHCGRVGLITDSNLVAIGTTKSLKIAVAKGIPIRIEPLDKGLGDIDKRIVDEFKLVKEKSHWRAVLKDENQSIKLQKSLSNTNISFKISRELPSMEDVYLSLTRKEASK